MIKLFDPETIGRQIWDLRDIISARSLHGNDDLRGNLRSESPVTRARLTRTQTRARDVRKFTRSSSLETSNSETRIIHDCRLEFDRANRTAFARSPNGWSVVISDDVVSTSSRRKSTRASEFPNRESKADSDVDDLTCWHIAHLDDLVARDRGPKSGRFSSILRKISDCGVTEVETRGRIGFTRRQEIMRVSSIPSGDRSASTMDWQTDRVPSHCPRLNVAAAAAATCRASREALQRLGDRPRVI